MPAWVAIAATDLNDYLVAAQASALRTAALAAGQTDPFGRVMPDVIAHVRMKIQSCASNRVSATANTVPPELKSLACYLIIEALQVRLPSLKLTEDQQRQIERGHDHLNRIADCKDSVSEPSNPLASETQGGGQIEVATKPIRLSTRAKLAGL